jgi:hypothetical protein
MKRTLLFVSCLSLGLGAAGCGGKAEYHASAGNQSAASRESAFDRPAEPRLKGAAVGNYNKGYVDGVQASAFFNKGQPLTDQQVDRLIEIGRRQGDPTGLLALEGYPDGYRTGAKHARNPYEKKMTPEQVAQVRKAQGLPPAPATDAVASSRDDDKKAVKEAKEDRKAKRKAQKQQAEASARD